MWPLCGRISAVTIFKFDAAEIPHRVEAAQAGKPVDIDSVDVSPAVPTSGAVERILSSVDQEPASKDGDTDEAVGEVLVSLVAVRFEG